MLKNMPNYILNKNSCLISLFLMKSYFYQNYPTYHIFTPLDSKFFKSPGMSPNKLMLHDTVYMMTVMLKDEF